MRFEERLMDLRKQKGWSQEEFGDKLGVTRQTVSKWELSMTTPEMEKLVAMSELFGISLDELVRGMEQSQPEISGEKIPETIPDKKRFTLEYKSEKTIWGMPLVHLNLKGSATGFFAIGLLSRGIISVGLLSLGVVSVGLLALGIIAVGAIIALGAAACSAFAVGIFALGGVSVGVFSLGGVAFGWLSFGGVSFGQYAIGGSASGEIAIGGAASGTIAIGSSVSGEITLQPPVTADYFRKIVNENLPDTPEFIVDFFASFAGSLERVN